MKKNVTIKSIAEELGVSFSTVSKSLNDDPSIKNETKLMVLEKAKELNYNKNYLAKGLRNMQTKTIGIILNDLDIPAYAEVVNIISKELYKYDYATLICDSQYDEDIERKNINTVLARMPESIIISPLKTNKDNLSLLNQVLDKTIILDHAIDNTNTNYIFIDHERAGYISASHMINYGHIHNLVLSGPKNFSGSSLFIKGVQQAYQEHNLVFNEDNVLFVKPGIINGCDIFLKRYNNIKEANSTMFTGIICFCDSTAFGVYIAAKKLGLVIPDDISVIGYDDNIINDVTSPPLTTIHIPKERVASLCSDLLISRLIKGENSLKVISLEPYLVNRSSVKRINT